MKYKEFEEAHRTGWKDENYKTLIQLLGINDAKDYKKFKDTFPPNREGYFRLMEVMNPQLVSFFFPSIQYQYC
jgi:hypothetical protein